MVWRSQGTFPASLHEERTKGLTAWTGFPPTRPPASSACPTHHTPRPHLRVQGLLLPWDPRTAEATTAAAGQLQSALLRAVGADVASDRAAAVLPLELCRVLLGAGPDAGDEELDDMIELARAAAVASGCTVASSGGRGSSPSSFRTAYTALHAGMPRPATAPAPSSEYRPHTILVLDRTLQELPWESVPALRAVPTTRLPSLAFLQARLRQRASAPTTTEPAASAGTYFVLNPSNDLPDTQERFQKAFTSYGPKFSAPNRDVHIGV